MAEDPAGKAGPRDDEAVYSARGLRNTAQWIVGAFAGIPTLAVVGALVRAPGDAGFDHAWLAWGVALGALGAFVGIAAFAQVFRPAALTDSQIQDAGVASLPEVGLATFDELRAVLESARREVGDLRVRASDDAVSSAAAQARVTQADATAETLHALAKDAKEGSATAKELEDEMATAREKARVLRGGAAEAIAAAARSKANLELATREYEIYAELKDAAYGLQAGQVANKRFEDALKWSVLAVTLVATSVIFLALAPITETSSPEQPVLVTVDLDPPGEAALGCKGSNIPALQTADNGETKTLIILPGGPCKAGAVKFRVSPGEPLGKVTAVKPVGD